MGERGQSFWGNLADAFIPGDAYRANGWDRQATIGGITQGALGLLGGPAGSVLGRMVNNGIQGKGWSPFARPQSGFGNLFQNNTGAINQMANPQGHGYDFQPWGGVGLPGMGQNPFAVNYQPPAQGFNGNSGGGARGAFTFGGYQSPEHREQSIAATQDSLRMAAARTPNNRQMHNNAS